MPSSLREWEKPPTSRPIGRLEELAYERHDRDRKEGPERGLVFDYGAAERVFDFFEDYLKHFESPWTGRPFVLEPWQKFIMGNLFGWKQLKRVCPNCLASVDVASGREVAHRPTCSEPVDEEMTLRRFRVGWIEVPRKNGKGPKSAGVGLYMTVADGEFGAQVYSAANKRDQAKIVWRYAKRMAQQSRELREGSGLELLTHNMNCEALGSKFEPLSADYNSMDGLSCHCNLIDEVHRFKDRGLIDVLISATVARMEPLTLFTTTAGEYDPEGVCWDEHDYSVKILEDVAEDDSRFVFIACADEDDDPFDEQTWKKANPNYGVSVLPEAIAAEAKTAKQQPSKLPGFKRFHLNLWVQEAKSAIPMDKYNACPAVLEPRKWEGRRCFGGLDAAKTTDLNAFTLTFVPDSGDGVVDTLHWFWMPEDRARELAQTDHHAAYHRWSEEGPDGSEDPWLILTPGASTDYDFIEQKIAEIAQRYEILEIGFDKWNIQNVATRLELEHDLIMVEVPQGPKTLSLPSKRMEALILSGKFNHGGNPVLKWMMKNLVWRMDVNENIAPDKRRSKDKIDGCSSTINALSRLVLHMEEIDDEEGLFVIG